MKKLILLVVLFAGFCTAANAKTYEEMFGKAPDMVNPTVQAVLKSMNFRQGTIQLERAKAKLQIPTGFYYLDKNDATKLLVQVWGNPPSTAADNQGMFFPAKYPPDDEKAWGSVIQYSADGYVSDEDAEATDYAELLLNMKASNQESNAERAKQGYKKMTLIGWASPPYYDKQKHALHWARDLLFEDSHNGEHTLNYAVRVLGREGVLELNFVASLSQLGEIKAAIPATLDIVKFSTGSGYTDFQSGDKVAAYGLAGLIAAGAGAKIAAKVGLLAGGLIFVKKFAVVFLIGFAAIGRFLAGLYKRNKDPSA